MKPVCYLCKSSEKELRPYGKDGQPICFPCMQASSERQNEARRQFEAALDAAAQSSNVVVFGTEIGPVPIGGTRH